MVDDKSHSNACLNTVMRKLDCHTHIVLLSERIDHTIEFRVCNHYPFGAKPRSAEEIYTAEEV